jgi:hypothetical protein
MHDENSRAIFPNVSGDSPVVDVGAHRRACAAEPQDLRNAEIELVAPIAIH